MVGEAPADLPCWRIAAIAMARFAFTAALGDALTTADNTNTTQLPAWRRNANRLPAVAFSYDGAYLACIAPEHGGTELVLDSMAAQAIRTRSRSQMIATRGAFAGRHVVTNSPC